MKEGKGRSKSEECQFRDYEFLRQLVILYFFFAFQNILN